MQASTVDRSPQRTPRPKPKFYDVPCFSHRKRTPNRLPPKAPVKSCPPVSRVFSSSYQNNQGVRMVSFLSESQGESANECSSSLYNPQNSQPFFEQCFEVMSRLGEGSFGEVFKVRSKEDGKMYAVKRSRQKFRGNIDRWRKLHEVEKHERLPPHCNCIRFYKAWEERLHLYIMAELCMMSLAEYADLHGKLPERRVWNVLLDLSQGLKHLHDNRLCHLDVKPANIFIGMDQFTCKLGDFGLTVSMDNDFHDVCEGDSRYIARELLSGVIGPAADVFSLGISLLELACDLELPSGGDGWHHLRNGHLPHEFIIDLSPDLVQILSAMMDSDPQQRPTADNILVHPSVRRMSFLRPLMKTSNVTGSLLRSLYSNLSNWFMTFVSMFFILLRISPWKQQLQSPPTTKSVPMETTKYYMSDSDEELESFTRSFRNQNSWISESPIVRSDNYSSRHCLYNGSPILLDYDDDNGHNLLSQEGVSPRTSSPNIIGTSGRKQNGRTFARSITIGPRNLMDIFNEKDT